MSAGPLELAEAAGVRAALDALVELGVVAIDYPSQAVLPGRAVGLEQFEQALRRRVPAWSP